MNRTIDELLWVAMIRYAALAAPKQPAYRTLVIVIVLIRDASRSTTAKKEKTKKKPIRTSVPGQKERAHIEPAHAIGAWAETIYPYRFGSNLNKSEVKRRPKEHNDTRIRSGSGGIHYHIRRRRKSKRGDGGELIRRRDQSLLFPFGEIQLSPREFYLFIFLLFLFLFVLYWIRCARWYSTRITVFWLFREFRAFNLLLQLVQGELRNRYHRVGLSNLKFLRICLILPNVIKLDTNDPR